MHFLHQERRLLVFFAFEFILPGRLLIFPPVSTIRQEISGSLPVEGFNIPKPGRV